MKSGRYLLVLLAIVMIVSNAEAAVRLSNLFTSNMVLQRETSVSVWGWADIGEKVSVSFNGQEQTATADDNGCWSVSFTTGPACKEGKDLVVTGSGNSITLANVLVGDVWLCSGQSNMEMSFGWGVINGDEEKKASSDYPWIRATKFRHETARSPMDNSCNSPWVVCTEGTLNNVTACGYFFARELTQKLDIPVGILDDNWSGCRIEPFTPFEGFAGMPQFAKQTQQLEAFQPGTEAGKKLVADYFQTIDTWYAQAKKCVANGKFPETAPQMPQLPDGFTGQHNAMIAPITKFPIKGVIWYQGCSNAGQGMWYSLCQQALIEGWRKCWKNSELPFYFVQLAAYSASNDNPADNGWGMVREAQRKTLDIPNTGMAVTLDIGNATDIHPKNKQDVGKRLALWALTKTYGFKDIVYSGPLFREAKIEGDKVRVFFDHAEGLMVGTKVGLEPTQKDSNGKLARFAIRGADKVWYWADAVIDGETVVVSSDKVKEPVAVRYAFGSNPEGCNLYNGAGLPASSFQSDTW